jgi:metal-responsive CopG/Arc/MetJ family transcriptional regulator
METIQVILDAPLLKAADRIARRFKTNRSALVRAALRAHLAALSRRDREEADRKGYARLPEVDDAPWGSVVAWPAE